MASAAGHVGIVDLLLSSGAEIEAVNNVGMTALMLAAQHNLADVAEVLISRGANLNAKDNNGRTAKQLADLQGHHDLAKKLPLLAKKKGHYELAEKPEKPEKPEKLGQGRSKRLRIARSVKETLFRRPTKKRKLKK